MITAVLAAATLSHVGEFHGFVVTPRLLDNMERCLAESCQLPRPEAADLETPERMVSFLKRKDRARAQAVHHMLLVFLAEDKAATDVASLPSLPSLHPTLHHAHA